MDFLFILKIDINIILKNKRDRKINILDQSLSIVLLHLRLLYLFRSLDLTVTLMIKTVKRDLEFNDIKNYQVFEVFIER